MMEKLMYAMIDICVKTNNTTTLRDSLRDFRNLFQHTNMNMLEAVFNYLSKENQKVLSEVEKKESTEKIT